MSFLAPIHGHNQDYGMRRVEMRVYGKNIEIDKLKKKD
jgi:hypothetical protein